jgi:hypothetical protein
MPWSNIAFLSLDKLASQKNKVSATRWAGTTISTRQGALVIDSFQCSIHDQIICSYTILRYMSMGKNLAYALCIPENNSEARSCFKFLGNLLCTFMCYNFTKSYACESKKELTNYQTLTWGCTLNTSLALVLIWNS